MINDNKVTCKCMTGKSDINTNKTTRFYKSRQSRLQRDCTSEKELVLYPSLSPFSESHPLRFSQDVVRIKAIAKSPKHPVAKA